MERRGEYVHITESELQVEADDFGTRHYDWVIVDTLDIFRGPTGERIRG